MSVALERLLNHCFRLDLLSCLTDEPQPLPVPVLSTEVGKPVTAVVFHLRLLEDCEVVRRVGEETGGDARYAATLDKHPPWVAEAVADHRKGRPRRSATVRTMGMKCDHCERLLQYQSEVVAVYRVGGSGSLQAKLVTEDTPGSGEAASPRATAKYHRDCYDEARNRDSRLPSIG